MSARFYWYSHARIAKMGYKPMAARQALAEAIAWVDARSYIADSVAGKLRFVPEVISARRLFTVPRTS